MRHPKAIILSFVVMVALAGQIAYESAPFNVWDLRIYRKMAQAFPGILMGEGAFKPTAYRLLGPYLAGALPMPDPWAFTLLTILGLGLFFWLMKKFLEREGCGPTGIGWVLLFLIWNRYVSAYFVWNPFQLNDVIAMLATVGGFMALQRQRWLMFSVLLLIGAFSREASLAMLAVAIVYVMERKLPRRHVLFAFAAAIPALVGFFAIRAYLPVEGGAGYKEAFAYRSLFYGQPSFWFRLFVNLYIPLSLLPLIFWRDFLEFLRGRWHVLVLAGAIVASILGWPGADKERCMIPTLIPLAIFYAQIFEKRLSARAGAPVWALPVLLLLQFIASLDDYTGLWTLPSAEASIAVRLGSLALGSALLIWLKVCRQHRRG